LRAGAGSSKYFAEKASNKPLLAVLDLVSQRKLLKAEEICRQFLQKVPHHVEGMRLLADIGARLGVLDDAEFLLESALKFEPDNKRIRIDYIQALRKRQKFAAALEQARLLLDTAPIMRRRCRPSMRFLLSFQPIPSP
jgi:cytochrome c-type biogenesis protein CcmH/NrfG